MTNTGNRARVKATHRNFARYSIRKKARNRTWITIGDRARISVHAYYKYN